MRSEKEMFDLILGFAKDDPRVRAVYMNGSRTNRMAPKDGYRDYDIVYLVRDFASFTANHGWIDVFGERLLLQMPEAMRFPSGRGHFNWMMLFADGNRLDLTLLPVEKPALIEMDSLTLPLLDKDGVLPHFPPASDRDYWVKKPSALFFHSCCNDFWWCLQNVVKGIARDEIPYAMEMYHSVVREGLHEMIGWYIGTTRDFAVSVGKGGKYFKQYLSPIQYKGYLQTYSDADPEHFWAAVFAMCDLYSALAPQVARSLGYVYHREEEEGMRRYLLGVKDGIYRE